MCPSPYWAVRLKRRERISARLGDVLSQLYLASAVLKRYDDEGRNEADLPLVHWGVQDALYKAEQAMDDLLKNFPEPSGRGLAERGYLPDRSPLHAHRLTSWTIKSRRFCRFQVLLVLVLVAVNI